MTVENITKVIYDAIDDKLGKDIAILNIGAVSSLCDYFVIATASSQRQGKEGYDSQVWVLLDYGDVMVHIFNEENRDFYNLEKLWKDAPYVDVDNLA